MYELSYRNNRNEQIVVRSEGIGALREKTRCITKPWEIYEIKQSDMNPLEGFKNHKRVVTRFDAMQMKRSFIKGKTVPEIAKKNRLSPETVTKILSKA